MARWSLLEFGKMRDMAAAPHLCIGHMTVTKIVNKIYEQPSHLLVSFAIYYFVCICLLVLI